MFGSIYFGQYHFGSGVDAEVSVVGEVISSSVGEVTATGGASTILDGEETTVSAGLVSSTGSAVVVLEGASFRAYCGWLVVQRQICSTYRIKQVMSEAECFGAASAWRTITHSIETGTERVSGSGRLITHSTATEVGCVSGDGRLLRAMSEVSVV